MILEKVVIGIAIFVSYFLQTSVDFFALGSVKPDFLLILTVYFALYRGSFAALWIGFFGGLLQDINLGGYTNLVKQDMQYYIGTSALAKTVIGYVAGKVARDIGNEVFLIVVFEAHKDPPMGLSLGSRAHPHSFREPRVRPRTRFF